MSPKCGGAFIIPACSSHLKLLNDGLFKVAFRPRAVVFVLFSLMNDMSICISVVGSESSSSAGSSGSLSRTHPPLQSTPLVSGVAATSPGCVSYAESGMGGQVGPGSTSYILLPLEAATGIPPGSILLNPHTGQCIISSALPGTLDQKFVPVLSLRILLASCLKILEQESLVHIFLWRVWI